ncbi:MAG: hypothetical protein HZC54_08105 [Verrucomicrobia bacterium]|nr:hypothetical protein [Verrucomicrobiota bacterium]
MKHFKSMIVVAAVVLGLMAADVMAGGKPDPYAIKVESPFKGVVSTITPTSLSAKGEVQLANPPKDGSGGKSKPNIQTVRFSIKGAKMTRNGQPCELKDVQKGDSVNVEFTSKADSEKRVASKLDFSTGGADAGEEKKAEGKK